VAGCGFEARGAGVIPDGFGGGVWWGQSAAPVLRVDFSHSSRRARCGVGGLP
jgi:hypothetical protein